MENIKQKLAEEFIKDFCVKVPYRDTEIIYFKGFLENEPNLIPTPKTIMQWIGASIDLAIAERDRNIVQMVKEKSYMDDYGNTVLDDVDGLINLINSKK